MEIGFSTCSSIAVVMGRRASILMMVMMMKEEEGASRYIILCICAKYGRSVAARKAFFKAAEPRGYVHTYLHGPVFCCQATR